MCFVVCSELFVKKEKQQPMAISGQSVYGIHDAKQCKDHCRKKPSAECSAFYWRESKGTCATLNTIQVANLQLNTNNDYDYWTRECHPIGNCVRF